MLSNVCHQKFKIFFEFQVQLDSQVMLGPMAKATLVIIVVRECPISQKENPSPQRLLLMDE